MCNNEYDLPPQYRMEPIIDTRFQSDGERDEYLSRLHEEQIKYREIKESMANAEYIYEKYELSQGRGQEYERKKAQKLKEEKAQKLKEKQDQERSRQRASDIKDTFTIINIVLNCIAAVIGAVDDAKK